MIKFKQLVGEKEVEHFWWDVIRDLFPNSKIEAREVAHKTDGLFVDDENKIRTLIEVKEELQMKSKFDQAKVLIQSIFYIKQFEFKGEKIPKAIFIADKNEAFVLHTNAIIKYLDYNVDWKIAPSQAHKIYPEMVKDISEDPKITPFVFDINDGFNFNAIKNKLIDLNQNVARLIKITDENLNKVYEYFCDNVLVKHTLTTNETANLFISLLISKDNYLHPKKKNTLHSKDYGFINVNEKNYISFFEHFDGEQYSRKEKEKLTEILDRLIQDETRRKKGEFFTPTPFVNLAHKYISDVFGSDWKEKFVVWDCCAGTLNLTRDYKFKELYCSTLEQSDLDTASSMNYNPESTKFQFDFLNDSDDKLPKELLEAINSGKEILFLINPPYIKATPNKGQDGTGICDTIMGNEMKNKKLGIASSQLSSQFLYKICKLQEQNKNIKIGIFNKPNYMTSDGFKDFRNIFLNNFGFVNGFLFNASHFADTKDSWGISFSLWNNIQNDIKDNFTHKLVDYDNYNCEIVFNDNKTLYNCDNSIKSNVIFSNKEKNDVYLPPIKSFITIDDKKEKLGYSKSIGYINNHSNNLMQQNVIFLASSVISANGNKSITDENFSKVMNLFAARKIVYQNWINDKDEYLAPNENHTLYKQYSYDSIIYSLFNNSSQQSSLRQVEYKNKLWDIKNEFFWMSKEEMMNLAEYYDELYQDAKFSEERFVNLKLFGENGLYNMLSPLAKEVLDMATELVKKSIKTRQLMSEEHPEYHLNSWDAGYAQLKLVWKEYHAEDFKKFRDKYKELENSLRPLVYELGFLKK